MRALKAVIALLFVVAGIFLGALNQQLIEIDLFFTLYQAPLGLTLIVSLLIGAIIGGALASFSLYLSRNSKKAPVSKAQPTSTSQEESK
jgi:uncharacterized integral membrane protein